MNSTSLIALTFYLIALAVSHASSPQCTYEIFVQTGGRKDAGTDSHVSLIVSAATGPGLVLFKLDAYGQMPAGHDYFERGNLDRFTFSDDCMTSEPCSMLLTSNGKGNKPGWYVDYVMVIQLGSATSRVHKWPVYQWLALDEAPHKLSFEINQCGSAAALP